MSNEAVILLCTDDQTLLEAARGFFLPPEYALCIVERSGSRLLEAIAVRRPAAVLTELVLSGFDAIGVLEALRGQADAPPVVVLSYFGHRTLEAQLSAAGALYCIVRPFDAEYVLIRLRSLLGWQPFRGEALDRILKALCFEPRRLGSLYLREPVLESAALGSGRPPSLTKELYPTIARRHNASPAQVERAVRTATELAWNRKAARSAFCELCGLEAGFCPPEQRRAHRLPVLRPERAIGESWLDQTFRKATDIPDALPRASPKVGRQTVSPI